MPFLGQHHCDPAQACRNFLFGLIANTRLHRRPQSGTPTQPGFIETCQQLSGIGPQNRLNRRDRQPPIAPISVRDSQFDNPAEHRSPSGGFHDQHCGRQQIADLTVKVVTLDTDE